MISPHFLPQNLSINMTHKLKGIRTNFLSLTPDHSTLRAQCTCTRINHSLSSIPLVMRANDSHSLIADSAATLAPCEVYRHNIECNSGVKCTRHEGIMPYTGG